MALSATPESFRSTSAAATSAVALYAIRTILAGRGDELLDLITTNVARRILD